MVVAQVRSFRQHGVPPETTTPEGARIVRWVKEVQSSILQRLNLPSEVRLAITYTQPEKRRVGMIVYADGVKWNPGGGEGLYVYKTAGWTKIV